MLLPKIAGVLVSPAKKNVKMALQNEKQNTFIFDHLKRLRVEVDHEHLLELVLI